MKNILAGTSNWLFILPFFILFVLFSFYIFPDYQSRLTRAAGEEITVLDSRFSYTQEEVLTDFERLGPDGRVLYAVMAGQLDMVYPMVFGFLFVLILAYLLRNITHPESNWMYLSLFPLLIILFDYLENFNTLHLLKTFPNITEQAVSRGEKFTFLKHIFGLTSVAMMLTLAVVIVVKRTRRVERLQG
jgi:hypothetical protein